MLPGEGVSKKINKYQKRWKTFICSLFGIAKILTLILCCLLMILGHCSEITTWEGKKKKRLHFQIVMLHGPYKFSDPKWPKAAFTSHWESQ